MFHGTTVDGSSSYIPGQEDLDADNGEDEGEDLGAEDGDGFENSPMSTNNRKRGSSTRDTATSPGKKSKSPMVKVLRGLINEIKGEREDAKREGEEVAKHEEAIAKRLAEEVARHEKESVAKQKKMREEFARCQSSVVECGAAEDSIDYYVDTQLFLKPGNRAIFQNIKTNEARMMWLKRHC